MRLIARLRSERNMNRTLRRVSTVQQNFILRAQLDCDLPARLFRSVRYLPRELPFRSLRLPAPIASQARRHSRRKSSVTAAFSATFSPRCGLFRCAWLPLYELLLRLSSHHRNFAALARSELSCGLRCLKRSASRRLGVSSTRAPKARVCRSSVSRNQSISPCEEATS